jgi:hypothetical protein
MAHFSAKTILDFKSKKDLKLNEAIENVEQMLMEKFTNHPAKVVSSFK